jgi:hypothetical protein
MDNQLSPMLDQVYEHMEGSEVSLDYSRRHGISSAAILTVHTDEIADALAMHLAPRIEGRVVIEVGGGIGLLALHMAQYAKRVFCIEANPMWSWTFAAVLLARKPKNVSFLFGAADEFAGCIRGDVALFCTHSDAAGMRSVAGKFAREVIDVYGEIVPEWNELRDLTRGASSAGDEQCSGS